MSALQAKDLQADANLVPSEQQPNKQAATLNAFLDQMRALKDRENTRQQVGQYMQMQKQKQKSGAVLF